MCELNVPPGIWTLKPQVPVGKGDEFSLHSWPQTLLWGWQPEGRRVQEKEGMEGCLPKEVSILRISHPGLCKPGVWVERREPDLAWGW